MVQSYIQKRLPAIKSPYEQKILTDYLYSNCMLPGSGEYCLNLLLKPGAYAFKPLVHRIPNLSVNNVSFIYGENDWMDIEGGFQVQSICKQIIQNGGIAPFVTVQSVSNAGHLLMLENWKGFNKAIFNALKENQSISI